VRLGRSLRALDGVQRLLGTAGERYRSGLVWLVSASGRAGLRVLSAAALASAALLYYAATHLSINTDTADMLDPQLPFLQADRALEAAFPQLSDLIVVIVQADTAHRANAAADTLAAQLALSSELFRHVYQPGRGPFFARNGLLYLNTEELWRLSERLAEAQPLLGAVALDPSLRGLFSVLERALGEDLDAENRAALKKALDEIDAAAQALVAGAAPPRSWQKALLQDVSTSAHDGRSFLLIQPRFDYASPRPAKEALDRVRHLARALEAEQGDVQIRLTGEVAMEDEELASVSRGAGIATAVAFALVCTILFLGLGSTPLVAAILVTLGMGLIGTAALAAAAIGHLNLISATFAVLFIGLGVDFGIQFAMRYQEELDASQDHAAALARAAAGVGGTLTLAALAAALSFLSFVPTDYRGLAELGMISGSGMMVALGANLTVLPAALSVMGVRPDPGGPRAGTVQTLFLSVLAVQRNRRILLGAAGVAAAGSLLLMPQVRFDFHPLNLRDPATASVAAFLSLLQDPSTTPYTIEVLVQDLEAAQALAARLDRLDVVDRTLTLTSFVPADQEEKLRILEDMNLVLAPLLTSPAPAAAPTPEEEAAAVERFREALLAASARRNDELAASAARLGVRLQRLAAMPGWPEALTAQLRHGVIGDLPDILNALGQSLAATRVGLAELPEELRRRYVSPDGRARVEVFPREDLRDNAAMDRFVRAVQALAPHAAGAPVTFVEAGNAVVRACLEATAIALLATLSLSLAALRRLRDAFLVLLPVVLAALLTAGACVPLDLSFNLANIIALPLLLGLSIAFGLYLVVRSRDSRDLERLLRSSTPRAVFFSALTTAVSFGALAFSEHPGMAGMGQLLVLALSLTLVSSLLVLPALLVECEGRGREGRRC
jgi:hopanoid biosynthesis associated RND transporter like protein HpnN